MNRVVSVYGYNRCTDVCSGEVRKLLQGFDSNSYVVVINDTMHILTDNTILYSIGLKTVTESTYAFQIKDLLVLDNPDVILYNQDVFFYVMHKVNKIKTNCIEVVAEESNLEENPTYMQLMALKSSDGMKFFHLFSPKLNRNILIPVFTGLPKMNKQDRLSLAVYNYINENNYPINYSMFLVKYTMFKKKFNRNIDICFTILGI